MILSYVLFVFLIQLAGNSLFLGSQEKRACGLRRSEQISKYFFARQSKKRREYFVYFRGFLHSMAEKDAAELSDKTYDRTPNKKRALSVKHFDQ